MTNDNPTPLDELADLIADATELNDDFDHLAFIIAIRPLLTRDAFRNLCLINDLCPIHHCDIFICRDDEQRSCRRYQ